MACRGILGFRNHRTVSDHLSVNDGGRTSETPLFFISFGFHILPRVKNCGIRGDCFNPKIAQPLPWRNPCLEGT